MATTLYRALRVVLGLMSVLGSRRGTLNDLQWQVALDQAVSEPSRI